MAGIPNAPPNGRKIRGKCGEFVHRKILRVRCRAAVQSAEPCKVSVPGLLFFRHVCFTPVNYERDTFYLQGPQSVGSRVPLPPGGSCWAEIGMPSSRVLPFLAASLRFFLLFFSLNKLRVATFGCASPNGGHWLDTAKFSIEMAARANEVAFYGLKARR